MVPEKTNNKENLQTVLIKHPQSVILLLRWRSTPTHVAVPYERFVSGYITTGGIISKAIH